MAFDLQEDYFYKNFTGGDGDSYSLRFLAGYHLDAVSPNAVEFPDNVIFPVVELETGFDGDVPFGMPMARTLKLEIDLEGLDIGDWADVATQIVRSNSSTARTVNGRDIFIPNTWVVTNNDRGWSFTGAQIPSTKSIEISNGVAKYTIDIIGWEKAVLERVTIEDLDLSNLTPTYTLNANSWLLDVIYSDIAGDGNYRHAGEDYGWIKRLYSMGDLFTQIETKVTNVMSAYAHGFANYGVDFGIADMDNIWTFYEQDPSDNGIKSATTVGFEDVLILGEVDTGSEVVGGFFYENGDGIYNYSNVWTFWQQFCLSFLVKIKIDEANPFDYSLYPILDGYGVTRDLETIDPIKYSLNPSDMYISESSCYVLGSGSDDKGEYKVITEYSSREGVSEDSESMFNNLTLKFPTQLANEKLRFATAGTSLGVTKKNAPQISNRTLFYRKASALSNGFQYFKLHDDCTLDIGGANPDITGDTIYTSVYYPTLTGGSYLNLGLEWYEGLVSSIQTRAPFYGIPYNRVAGAKVVLGNENQGTLDATFGNQITNANYLKPDFLGHEYTLDLANVSSVPSLGEFSDKFILTSAKFDIIDGSVDCKFFMRGDSGS